MRQPLRSIGARMAFVAAVGSFTSSTMEASAERIDRTVSLVGRGTVARP